MIPFMRHKFYILRWSLNSFYDVASFQVYLSRKRDTRLQFRTYRIPRHQESNPIDVLSSPIFFQEYFCGGSMPFRTHLTSQL